jgi:hypothetical protein
LAITTDISVRKDWRTKKRVNLGDEFVVFLERKEWILGRILQDRDPLELAERGSALGTSGENNYDRTRRQSKARKCVG